MKLQNLVIVFLIIVIPIMLVYSIYFNGEVKTLKLQRQYDAALKDATYDAVMSFEQNSMNDALASNPESKRENIKAAINMFVKSLATSNGLSSYNENDIKDYIPAVVFGLYDGFYMYTPTLNEEGKYEHMLKNFVYYSEQIPGTDIVIRYSLDNYVAVSGTFKDESDNKKYLTKAGYLEVTNKAINTTETLYENIIIEKATGVTDTEGSTYDYYLIPCKYKYDEHKRKIYIKSGQQKKLNISDGTVQWNINNDSNIIDDDLWYTYSDLSIVPTETPTEEKDKSAKSYQTEANSFSSVWSNILNEISDNSLQAALTIDSNNDPEDPDSAFSIHRNKIIQSTIQSNLDTAIAAYANRQAITTTKFKMPKLLETDWQKIYSNVSVITFLQGINIGLTEYNNYCVLNSTNHTEYPNPNSFYFIQNDEYHDIRDSTGGTGYRANEFTGTRIITQPLASYTEEAGKIKDTVFRNYWMYYYKHLETACYNCINTAYAPAHESIYQYVKDGNNKAYWTALYRERYNTPKSTDNFND